MSVDLENVQYYTEMLEYAEKEGLIEVVQHGDGSFAMKHNGGLNGEQLIAAYYGLLAKAGQLTAESVFPACEVAIDPAVIEAITNPKTLEPEAEEQLPEPTAQEPDAVAEVKGPKFIFK